MRKAREAEELVRRQDESYASIKQELERSNTLASDLTFLQKEGYRNLFQYEDVLSRINEEVDEARQAELKALADRQLELAMLKSFKEVGSGFTQFFEIGRQIDEQLNSELTKTQELLKGSYDIISGQLTSGIKGLIDGSKQLSDVLSGILDQLSNLFLQAAFNSLGSAFSIPGYADGGRPAVNQPSIVGERGPELFVPDVAGTVIPNDAFDIARAAMGGAVSSTPDAFAENAASISTTNNYIRNASESAAQEAALGSITSGDRTIKFESMNVGGMDVVTREEAIAIGQESAKQAKAQVFSDLKNKPARRAMLGMR